MPPSPVGGIILRKETPLRKIALCYLRLSNRGKNEVSIEMQRERCRLECERLGLTPVFFEEGLGKHSANTRTHLPEWDKLYARALIDPAVYCIMSYDHERSFRHPVAARTTAAALNAVGVKIIFTTQGEVDTTSANGKMIFTVQAAFAEHYSNYVSEKLTHHYADLKASGQYVGHKNMYGLSRSGSEKNNTVLWTMTADFPAIVAAVELYARRSSPADIADTLHDKGITWIDQWGKRSRPFSASIYNVIRRIDFYAPFLDPALVKTVKAIYAAKQAHRDNGRRNVHPKLLLQRALYCECGKRLTIAYYQSRITKARPEPQANPWYYHPRTVNCRIQPACFRAEKIDKEFFERLEIVDRWTDEYRADILDGYERQYTQPAVTTPHNNAAAIEKLAKDFSEKRITREKFMQQLEELEQTPVQPPRVIPEIFPPTYLASHLQKLPNLVTSLRVAAVLEPNAANETVRALFRVTIKEGHISHIALVGTEGKVTL